MHILKHTVSDNSSDRFVERSSQGDRHASGSGSELGANMFEKFGSGGSGSSLSASRSRNNLRIGEGDSGGQSSLVINPSTTVGMSQGNISSRSAAAGPLWAAVHSDGLMKELDYDAHGECRCGCVRV